MVRELTANIGLQRTRTRVRAAEAGSFGPRAFTAACFLAGTFLAVSINAVAASPAVPSVWADRTERAAFVFAGTFEGIAPQSDCEATILVVRLDEALKGPWDPCDRSSPGLGGGCSDYIWVHLSTSALDCVSKRGLERGTEVVAFFGTSRHGPSGFGATCSDIRVLDNDTYHQIKAVLSR